MADQPPPPYSGPDRAPSYPPGDTTKQGPPPDGQQPSGYPPQATPGYPPQPGPAYPAPSQAPYPGVPGYPPQAPGYPAQPGYPQQGYDQNKGYAPVASGYPAPQGQGYIQQPAGYMANNTNTTVVVTQQPTITAAVIPYVNDYMGLSIFSCLFCCWCVGLFAIIKSSEARSNYNAGNYTEAMASATMARNLSYISIFCGIGISILIIIVISVQ